MTTYDEAKQAAQAKEKSLDSVLEYGDAYVFYNSKARGNAHWDNEVVVLKKDGRIVSMSEYVMGTKDSGKPKHIKF